MSVKIKPEVRTLVCDRCSAVDSGGFGSPFWNENSAVTVRATVTSPMGDSAGNVKQFDLCAKCSNDFRKFMRFESDK
jgi:hypothetical protein